MFIDDLTKGCILCIGIDNLFKFRQMLKNPLGAAFQCRWTMTRSERDFFKALAKSVTRPEYNSACVPLGARQTDSKIPKEQAGNKAGVKT